MHAPSDHALDDAIPKLASYRVDAIVSALAILSQRAAATLAKLKIPVISFNTGVKNELVTPVSCDNFEAGRAIADLFAARGACSFGFISGPVESHASAGRLAGYRDRIDQLGIGPVMVARGDYRYEGGFAAALEMFGRDRRPEALFCANDLLAIGAIDALRKKLCMRVPEDVIVAGFDDIPAAAWASIDLTTFVQDGARMVDAALAIVTAAQAGKRQELAPVVVSARLIERGTTRMSRSGEPRFRRPTSRSLDDAFQRQLPGGARNDATTTGAERYGTAASRSHCDTREADGNVAEWRTSPFQSRIWSLRRSV